MDQLDPEIRQLAKELGEIRLLWLDMSHARALFERLAEMPDGFGDFRLASALWTAGLTTYRRAFTGRRRDRPGMVAHTDLRGLVDALEPRQRELHGDVLLMAQRHVAHRVTDQDEVEVWLEVEHGPPPRASRVRTRQIVPVARTHNAFELATLAKHLADQLEEKCRYVEQEIVASANASGVGRGFVSASGSSEWVNILSGDPGSIPKDAPTTN
jgi:hypothetical protein